MDRKNQSYDILLVEDDEEHAELFRAILETGQTKSYRLRHVKCLGKAHEATREKSWDLIVLDLGLPESQGIETLELLNNNGALKLPIVVQTASDDIELGQMAIKEGALDFIAKNFSNPHMIKSTIQYAIERQRQRLSLEQARSDLKSFAHCAAHDLKAPLGTISACAEIVKSELKDLDVSDTTRNFVDLIEKCADNSIHLIQDLLKFSELGAKAVTAQLSSLEEISNKAKDHLRAAIEKTGTTLKIEPLPALEFDPDLILHVMQNLIGNGIKYRSKTSPEIVISAEKKSTHSVISIADNGIGIAEQYHERVFEPFKRLNPSNDSQESSGLGLSICKRIIEAHHGKIWVNSTLGEGSIFRFSLPQH